MRLETIRALPGPNIYTDKPVLVARLDLQSLTELESTQFPGFTDRLLALLPGLRQHHCAKGEPGGFVERLYEGTYFGHITEHVAIELSNLAGMEVNQGKTRIADRAGLYNVIVEYKLEEPARFLLNVAVEVVQAVLDGREYPIQEKLQHARRLVAETDLGPSTRAIVDAAVARGIPTIRLDEESLVQLGYGVNRRMIMAAQTNRTSAIAVDIAGDKHLTKRLLEGASIPVPRGIIASSKEEAVAALQTLHPPLVVKPLDGHQGKGVTLRVETAEGLTEAFERAVYYSSRVVVEEFFSGKDYRILVVDGKMVAASERTPAHVVADGEHTIQQLIDRENQNPKRGEGHEKPLTKIVLDKAGSCFLKRSGWTLEDVPPAGETVFLRDTANLSTGGTARDVTDQVHPSIVRLAERAARVVGLDICGVDLLAPHVDRPLPETGAGVVELNASPGLRMHVYPAFGESRDVGTAIVKMMFPGESDGRIPVVAITGTNGKTTVTRMIAHIISAAGRNVGMTTTDGIWIGGECVAQGDLTGFHSARTVLTDPQVEVAVLETARGGIVRRSLGYDWSDVGVITNVQPDHLGQDGINSLDDLLFVKSLIAERVRAGGTVVLNAEDERLAQLPANRRMQKLERKIVFFSLSESNPVIQQQIAAGETVYFTRDGWLVEVSNGDERHIIREAELPATLGGLARFQVANALAALAACRALGISWDEVAIALSTFDSGQHNQGRMNIYRLPKGHVIVDYGHNPGALAALASVAAAYEGGRVTGIFTAPGDRPNDLVEELGRVAARGFDRLIIREDEDLRGRQPGEITAVLCNAIQQECPGKECRSVREENAALRTALSEMEEGELIVFFFEKHTDPCHEVLREFGAVPTDGSELVTQPMHT
ncbi:MAG: cyanophycin synthetase [Gemmataceae bacterium]